MVSGCRRRARLYAWSRRFADTKGCRKWEGMLSSGLVIDKMSKTKRYCSNTSQKVHVSGYQRNLRNSSTHVNRRPDLIRLGSERASIWCMHAVMPGASLPLRGSAVVWIFSWWPGLLGGMRSVIFAERAGPLEIFEVPHAKGSRRACLPLRQYSWRQASP